MKTIYKITKIKFDISSNLATGTVGNPLKITSGNPEFRNKWKCPIPILQKRGQNGGWRITRCMNDTVICGRRGGSTTHTLPLQVTGFLRTPQGGWLLSPAANIQKWSAAGNWHGGDRRWGPVTFWAHSCTCRQTRTDARVPVDSDRHWRILLR